MDFFQTPLVSVVMPSFNQAEFILASIESVLSQDYPNIELIVADGGSTDGTVELLTHQAKADSRLRWISEPDRGPADALNKAFRAARGTMFGWLNSDDLYTSGAISRAVDVLNANNERVMVYGEGQHIDEHGAVKSTYPTRRPDTTYEAFRDGCFICQPTMFMKRTVWVLMGDLDLSLKTAFDFEYWLRAFKAFSGRIGFVDEVQAYSRLHSDCITMKMRRTVALEGVRVIRQHVGEPPIHWLLTYMEELLSRPALAADVGPLRAHLLETLNEARSDFSPEAFASLRKLFEHDRRLR